MFLQCLSYVILEQIFTGKCGGLKTNRHSGGEGVSNYNFRTLFIGLFIELANAYPIHMKNKLMYLIHI